MEEMTTEIPSDIWRHILSFNTLPHHSTVSSLLYDIEIDLYEERLANIIHRYEYIDDIIDNRDIESLIFVTNAQYVPITYKKESMSIPSTIYTCVDMGFVYIAMEMLDNISRTDIIEILTVSLHQCNIRMLSLLLDSRPTILDQLLLIVNADNRVDQNIKDYVSGMTDYSLRYAVRAGQPDELMILKKLIQERRNSHTCIF
jgi:hypothetical protein